MKQSHNYDCGHVCIIDHGYTPPSITCPLTGKQIVEHIPSSFFISTLDFLDEGIYIFIHFLDGDNNDAHWVSYRKGRVLDPSDGNFYSPYVLKEKYETMDYKLVGAVIVGDN